LRLRNGGRRFSPGAYGIHRFHNTTRYFVDCMSGGYTGSITLSGVMHSSCQWTPRFQDGTELFVVCIVWQWPSPPVPRRHEVSCRLNGWRQCPCPLGWTGSNTCRAHCWKVSIGPTGSKTSRGRWAPSRQGFGGPDRFHLDPGAFPPTGSGSNAKVPNLPHPAS